MRQRLRKAGWTTYEPILREVHGCRLCDPAGHVVVLEATRADNFLGLTVDPTFSAGEIYIVAQLSRATPWAVYPASAVAGLIGAFIGWLVFGWASRRLEKHYEILRLVAILAYTLTMLLWWIPILEMTPLLVSIQARAISLAYEGGQDQPGQPRMSRGLGRSLSGVLDRNCP